ncbi:F-box/kelch-repeat protein At3g23880-like [Lotus japonicus]|uniref:F-box/kelch-repeat protein At3g23880-like n=1 Tax=Lotus japonicus TaxID=34305 RepID=UPI00258FB20A|nr:F-box/kelch-repeat protein At3g23880-like [Lotus japonicus]
MEMKTKMMENETQKEKQKNLNLTVTKLILEILRLPVRFLLHMKNKMMMMMNDKEENEKEKEDLNLNIALSHELIVEILLRLPVRSLLRFKCVCTAWNSLISNPQFAKSHFDLGASPTHRLLLDKVNDDSVESFDFEASLHDDSAVVNLKFPPYIAPSFLTLGSCRGFILLATMMGPSAGDLILWNPSTGSHREIPVTYDDWDSWYDPSTRVRQGIPDYVGGLLFGFLYGFGYDQSNDDYLLVLIRLGVCEPQVIVNTPESFVYSVQFGPLTRPRIEVLSVKTNVPSFIYGEEVEYLELGAESVSGLFLNQSLHWLVISRDTQRHVIIAFDLVERSLYEIPLSPDLAEELSYDTKCHLRVLGGCLGLCYSGEDVEPEMTEIWVMKEYKVQASWTKSCALPGFLPICLTQGGGVLGLDESGGFQKLNDKGELLENHAYGLSGKGALKYFDMYRESLLPLPGEETRRDEDDVQ